jgi:hypothetical protein
MRLIKYVIVGDQTRINVTLCIGQEHLFNNHVRTG